MMFTIVLLVFVGLKHVTEFCVHKTRHVNKRHLGFQQERKEYNVDLCENVPLFSLPDAGAGMCSLSEWKDNDKRRKGKPILPQIRCPTVVPSGKGPIATDVQRRLDEHQQKCKEKLCAIATGHFKFTKSRVVFFWKMTGARVPKIQEERTGNLSRGLVDCGIRAPKCLNTSGG